MLANPFRALLDLLPSRPLLVGVVTAVGDGVVTVELPGGGVVTARGTAAEDDTVFIRDGAVEGIAPSLPIVLIDV